jgi:polysaccharide pyruvyl transferase WcaK-like protein
MKKIVLSGVGTINKGAELMLYAILQEIEYKFPDAYIYLPDAVPQGYNYIKTNLVLKPRFPLWLNKFHIQGIMERLHLPFYNNFINNSIIKGADYFIDASGFLFSDQFNLGKDDFNFWAKQLSAYRRQDTKIVFLPQAFGPIENDFTKKIIKVINEYSDLIFVREQASYNYLESLNINMDKMKIYPDFTSLVHGIFPAKYEYLKDGICIIPNSKMVEQGIISLDQYVKMLSEIINICSKLNHKVYLLNHEGIGDEKIMIACKSHLGEDIELVTGLNALEVKGLIGSAYLCISSRFHGVASSLNSGVPCLATSWSHKYKLLFDDYKQQNCILDTNQQESYSNKIISLLNEENNFSTRGSLLKEKQFNIEKTKKMWANVW